MPSSFASSFPNIVESLIDVAPKRVVDIGPGWGKYGLACREYLPELTSLVAVEVQQGRKPPQDGIYDRVEEADVRTLPQAFWADFDVALIIDVIEHMTIKEGLQLMRAMLAENCTVICSTPKVWMEQHDDNNPYETHVSLWDWQAFRKLNGLVQDRSTMDAIIYTIGA